MIRAAVVGLGIGEQHALAILDNLNCQLTAVCDLDTQKLDAFQAKHPFQDIKRATFKELLQDPTLNMITLASFDDDHYQQVIDGLNANKHIFVEKPLCQTWEQLVSLNKAIKRAPAR